jgi:hypothetical protein
MFTVRRGNLGHKEKRAFAELAKKLSLLIPLVLFFGLAGTHESTSGVPLEEKDALVLYLKSHWQAPEEYVIAKFRDHDLVFLGEGHKFKHDVELVQSLIPLLYRIGVFELGIEFGCHEYQDKADRLVTAEAYDENLARWLMFKWGPYWPYKEYLDIYRKAWELNRSLPLDAPKFRIVHLDYRANWALVRESMPTQLWKNVFFQGERDDHMAKVIIDEFVKKKKKALIYSGGIHAFTRFHEPNYDFQTRKGRAFVASRMGNIVYAKIGERVFSIQLHFPWPARERDGSVGYPVDGAIDAAMRGLKDKRVGFDVVGTPFGRLRDTGSIFAAANDNLTLDALCDGYIFQKNFSEYEGVSVDPLFITQKNFREALEFLPNPRLRKIYKTPYQFLTDMQMKADFKLQFGDLK